MIWYPLSKDHKNVEEKSPARLGKFFRQNVSPPLRAKLVIHPRIKFGQIRSP